MPSTAIRRYLYDEAERRLVVTFISGRTYIYENVPGALYAAFRAAPSKGAFFNAEIRDRYAFHALA
jgi:hypothetical protein